MRKLFGIIILTIFSLFICNYVRWYLHYLVVRHWSSANVDNMQKNLEDFKSVLDKNNVFFLLSEGTALGAIREQSIIHGDTDVDVSVFEKDEKVFFEKCLPELEKMGFWVARRVWWANGAFSIVRGREYIDIDIYGKDKFCFAAVNIGGKCSTLEPYLKPYGRAKIGDIEYNVPNIKYIEFLYGKEGWKTPSSNKGDGTSS